MTKITTLQPHDPLPDGPAIILMRRFEEDAPKQIMMELIVIHASQSEETSRLLTDDGEPLPYGDAVDVAEAAAGEHGIEAIYYLDRTEGPREREITAHDGDRSINMDGLSDTDAEDGVSGSDMRDMGHNTAPRKF